MWGFCRAQRKVHRGCYNCLLPKKLRFKISLSLSLSLSLLCLCKMCEHVHVCQYQCTCQTACVEVRDSLRSKSSLFTWSQCPGQAFTAMYTRLTNLWASQDSPIPTCISVGTMGLQPYLGVLGIQIQILTPALPTTLGPQKVLFILLWLVPGPQACYCHEATPSVWLLHF